MEKTKLQRFIFSVKLDLKLSLLPKSVEKFHLHLLIKICRILGGISFIFIIKLERINYSS